MKYTPLIIRAQNNEIPNISIDLDGGRVTAWYGAVICNLSNLKVCVQTINH